VVLVSAVAFLLFGVIFWAIGYQVVGLAQNLPEYEQIIRKKITDMRQGSQDSAVQQVLGTAQRVTEEIVQPGDKKQDPISEEKGKSESEPVPVILQGNIWAMLGAVVGTVQEVIRLIASAGLVILLTIVNLIFKEEIRDRFIQLTGASRLTVTTKALDEAAKRISDYFFRKFLVNAICGVTVALGLLALEFAGLGVPFGILWGFLLAILRIIPGLGFWLALVPPAMLSLIAQEGWETFFLVVGLFLLTEIVALNVLEPRFYGRQIGLLPVATLISLTFWTWLWGPIGLLLAIPITLCLAVLGKYVPALRFLSVLLSDQPAMDPRSRYYQRLIASDQDEATEIVEHYMEGAAAECVYDDVMLPALSQAKHDVAVSELTPLDQEFFFKATREILDNVCEAALPRDLADTSGVAGLKMLGCPVGDDNDELALTMVDQQLRARGYSLEVGPPGLLSAEVVNWVEAENPTLVCVLSVTPGELTQTRFICKRLRARLPEVMLLVARLGQVDDRDAEKEVLLKAGANQVTESVSETARELMQMLQKASLTQHPSPEPTAAPV
jgi:predicted PurR-regulated permease PerM